MTPTKHTQKWNEIISNRECGSCYSCCVYLGIEELKKWTGQTCKHLDGRDATKRCSIYDKRPHACSIYSCMWRTGFGPDNLRPIESGLLITPYASEMVPNTMAFTVIIAEPEKAKNIDVTSVATELLMLGEVSEVRIVNYQTKSALMFFNGSIYKCKLLPPDGYEALIFNADFAHPVGHYAVMDTDKADAIMKEHG